MVGTIQLILLYFGKMNLISKEAWSQQWTIARLQSIMIRMNRLALYTSNSTVELFVLKLGCYMYTNLDSD